MARFVTKRIFPLVHFLAGTTLAGLLGVPVAVATNKSSFMEAKDLKVFVSGNAYKGIDPSTNAVIAEVIYRVDGSSILWFANGNDEPGTYRFEGNAYCTRYLNFRNNAGNCFRLKMLGQGRAQAFYTNGRKALILESIDPPARLLVKP